MLLVALTCGSMVNAMKRPIALLDMEVSDELKDCKGLSTEQYQEVMGLMQTCPTFCNERNLVKMMEYIPKGRSDGYRGAELIKFIEQSIEKSQDARKKTTKTACKPSQPRGTFGPRTTNLLRNVLGRSAN